MSRKIFDRFSWPVPHAFKTPLNRCRFEEGDFLYDNEAAYKKSWKEAMSILNYSAQVEFPPRSNTSGATAELGTAFESNWESTVKVRLKNFKTGESQTITTMQGNLSCTLWTGQITFLHDEKLPTLPITAKVAHKRLNEVKFQIRKTSAFFMVIDSTSDLHSDKLAALSKSFGNDFELIRCPLNEFAPFAELSLLPTLDLVGFHLNLNQMAAEEKIKEAFYRPSQNRKTDGDRFSTRTHGVLATAS